MTKKYEVLKKIYEDKIIAIIRAQNENQAFNACESLIEGGIENIELTFTTPFAHRVLENLSHKYSGSKISLGAGSILDSETARIAILSGARYLVTPTLNKEVILLSNRYGIPVFAGVYTISEAMAALESGVEVVKLFPSNNFKSSVIKDFKAPIPNIEIIPVGGVDIDNILDWLKAGAFALGIGGSLTKGLKDENYKNITEMAL